MYNITVSCVYVHFNGGSNIGMSAITMCLACWQHKDKQNIEELFLNMEGHYFKPTLSTKEAFR